MLIGLITLTTNIKSGTKHKVDNMTKIWQLYAMNTFGLV